MEIPAIILAGILRVESSTVMTHFGPARVGAAPRGKHGERGVMQVRYDAFREVALPGERWSDMDWNHHLSTAIGCRYLIKLYTRFKCWDKAVMAYNAGASNYEAGKPYLKKVKELKP